MQDICNTFNFFKKSSSTTQPSKQYILTKSSQTVPQSHRFIIWQRSVLIETLWNTYSNITVITTEQPIKSSETKN